MSTRITREMTSPPAKVPKDAIPEHISDHPRYDEAVPEWVEPELASPITDMALADTVLMRLQ
jgi:hypothetical protein